MNLSSCCPDKRGPKLNYDAPVMVRLHVRVTQAQAEDMRAIARDNQMCLAQFMRDAINEAVLDYRDKPVFPR